MGVYTFIMDKKLFFFSMDLFRVFTQPSKITIIIQWWWFNLWTYVLISQVEKTEVSYWEHGQW